METGTWQFGRLDLAHLDRRVTVLEYLDFERNLVTHIHEGWRHVLELLIQ